MQNVFSWIFLPLLPPKDNRFTNDKKTLGFGALQVSWKGLQPWDRPLIAGCEPRHSLGGRSLILLAGVTSSVSVGPSPRRQKVRNVMHNFIYLFSAKLHLKLWNTHSSLPRNKPTGQRTRLTHKKLNFRFSSTPHVQQQICNNKFASNSILDRWESTFGFLESRFRYIRRHHTCLSVVFVGTVLQRTFVFFIALSQIFEKTFWGQIPDWHLREMLSTKIM